MARRTAEIIPIFCVKDTGGGIISFSTFNLIVSVVVYRIVLPSRSTWVEMHLQKSCIFCIHIWKKNNECIIHMTCINFSTKTRIMSIYNNVHVKNLLEIFSIIFKLGFVFSSMFCFRSVTCLVRSVYRICRIIKISIWRSIPFQLCSRMSIRSGALNLIRFKNILLDRKINT